MDFVLLYAVTLVVFLGVDAVWLRAVMKPMFEARVPDLLARDMKLGPAAGFYALYVVGILYFASSAGLMGKGLAEVAFDGALLGFLAYGTYEATNLSTLKGWQWTMALSDIAWGSFLTALSAVLGLVVTRGLLGV